mmetsp:Transcript_6142/g.27638  ORF Transcript_6142/g.27638 Transcript_6142/m.27638 type:complete len:475 (+) Transcript_6142:2131-3555(+)
MRRDGLVAGAHEHQAERQRRARCGDVQVDHVALHDLPAARARRRRVLAGRYAPVPFVNPTRQRGDGLELLSLAELPVLDPDARVIAAGAAGLPGHRRPTRDALAATGFGAATQKPPEPLGNLQIRQPDRAPPAAEGDEAERETRGEGVSLATVRRAVAAGLPANLSQQNLRHEPMSATLVQQPHRKERRSLHRRGELNLGKRARVPRGQVKKTHLARVRVHRPATSRGDADENAERRGVVFLHQIPVQVRVGQRPQVASQPERHQHPGVRVRGLTRAVKHDPRAGQLALGPRRERQTRGGAVVELGPSREIRTRRRRGEIQLDRRAPLRGEATGERERRYPQRLRRPRAARPDRERATADGERGGSGRERPQPRLLRGDSLGVVAAPALPAAAAAAAVNAERYRRGTRALEQRADLAHAVVAAEEQRADVRLHVSHAVGLALAPRLRLATLRIFASVIRPVRVSIVVARTGVVP